MPKAKLTENFVAALDYTEEGQVIYTDTDLPGFGVVVGKKTKTYFAQRDINRKTVRVTIGKHVLIKNREAREEAKSFLLRMAKGENPNKVKHQAALDGITLAQAFENYKAGKKNLSKTTLKNLQFCEDSWFQDWLKKPLKDITKQLIIDRHKKIGEETGNATANIGLRVLRTVYNFAMVTNENLPSNPVQALSQAKSWYTDVKRQTVIKPTQLKPWYDAVMLIDNSVIRDYFCLLLFTGMRRQEGLTLKWENVDFQEKVITVPKTKSGRPLVIPMSQYVYALMEARKKRTEDSIWVFPSRGKTGHLVEPKKSVAWVSKKSGVTFMLHDLRRTFITIAESLDISAYAVKQLVNHGSGGDVTAGYIIMSVDRLRDPMQKIADYIMQKISLEGGSVQ